MATHSSILAWEMTEEPRGLQSMGPQRVRQDRATEHTAQRTLRPVKQTLNAGSLPGELSVSRGAYSRPLPCDLCLRFLQVKAPSKRHPLPRPYRDHALRVTHKGKGARWHQQQNLRERSFQRRRKPSSV